MSISQDLKKAVAATLTLVAVGFVTVKNHETNPSSDRTYQTTKIKTDKRQVKADLPKNMVATYITEARSYQKRLETSGDPENLLTLIEERLKQADVGYEALDPAGQKTAEQMKVATQELAAKGFIANARKYSKAVSTSRDPDIELSLIAAALEKSKTGYEVLDPTGQKNVEEMKSWLHDQAVTGYISQAREFAKEVSSPSDPSNNLALVENYLRKAGVGYEALDPTGQKNAEEMKADIQKQAAIGFIEKARSLAKELPVLGIPDIDLDLIADALKRAGVGYEVLDPTGKKTAGQVKAELDEQVEKAHGTSHQERPINKSGPDRFFRRDI